VVEIYSHTAEDLFKNWLSAVQGLMLYTDLLRALYIQRISWLLATCATSKINIPLSIFCQFERLNLGYWL